jgi:nickel-dependent lactate racemase
MIHTLEFGRRSLELELDPARVIADLAGPVALTDLGTRLRAALEKPYRWPALHRALTEDDEVVIVYEPMPELVELLVPLLEHVVSAGVQTASIRLLSATGANDSGWIEDLPDELCDVLLESHDPKERRKLAYLATTKSGRRLYLNRSLVDAAQVVVLTIRHFDLLHGFAGGEGALYPTFCDEEIRNDSSKQANLEVPTLQPWPTQQEAEEAVGLLGQPFFVQLIPARGQGIAEVICGTKEALQEGRRRFADAWLQKVPKRADVVLATITGDPSQQSFAALASAAFNASRVVKTNGRIIVLSEGKPVLPPAIEILLRAEDAEDAVTALDRAEVRNKGAALQWASAASQARISVMSEMDGQTIEDLFASPISANEIAHLVALITHAGGDCLLLRDAHRLIAVVE